MANRQPKQFGRDGLLMACHRVSKQHKMDRACLSIRPRLNALSEDRPPSCWQSPQEWREDARAAFSDFLHHCKEFSPDIESQTVSIMFVRHWCDQHLFRLALRASDLPAAEIDWTDLPAALIADPHHAGNKPSKFTSVTIEANCPPLWVLRRQLPVAMSTAACVAMKAEVAGDRADIERWKSRIILVFDWQNDLRAGVWERNMTVVNLTAQVGRVDAGVSACDLVVMLLHELARATPCTSDGACARGPAFVGGLRVSFGVLCGVSEIPSSPGDRESPLDEATHSLAQRPLVIGKVAGGCNFVRLGDGADIGWLGQQRLAAVLFGAGLPIELVTSEPWKERTRVVRELSRDLRKVADLKGEGSGGVVWSCVETAMMRVQGEWRCNCGARPPSHPGGKFVDRTRPSRVGAIQVKTYTRSNNLNRHFEKKHAVGVSSRCCL
jgi:hypothetical protein